jgi:HEAT repeat protein
MRYDGGPPWDDECRNYYQDLHILKKIAVLLDKILDEKYRNGLPSIAKDIKKCELKLNYMLDRKSKYGLYRVKHEIKQEIIKCAQNLKGYIDKIDKVEDVVKHSAMVINEIKKDVRRIENVLTDPKFEDTVKNSALILNEIKKDMRKVESIVADPKFDDTVRHSAMLLNDIKKDVKKIECILADPKFDDTVKHSVLLLNQIKKDVKQIENALADPKFDDTVKHSVLLLNEIKKDVKQIEDILADPKFDDTVKHSVLLLNEIKKVVKNIEETVADPKHGDIIRHLSMVLIEVRKDIAKVEDIITNPDYGLKAINNKLVDTSTDTLTTGPLFVDFEGIAVTSVHLKAQNYSNKPQSVTFAIHNLDDNCPFTTGKQVVTLENIPAFCAQSAEVPLEQFTQNLEIKAVLSDTPNVFVYAAILDISNPTASLVKKDVLHSEWTPIKIKKHHCDENFEAESAPLE